MKYRIQLLNEDTVVEETVVRITSTELAAIDFNRGDTGQSRVDLAAMAVEFMLEQAVEEARS